MSHWGAILLVLYVALGLSPLAPAKAARLGVVVTTAVVAFAILTAGGLR